MDYYKLASLYTGVSITTRELEIQDNSDGAGLLIVKWNVPDKPQPTIAQLEALEPQLEIAKKNAEIQAQIDKLELIAGVRPQREFALSSGYSGAITAEYPNGKIKDIDDKISELRSQIIN